MQSPLATINIYKDREQLMKLNFYNAVTSKQHSHSAVFSQ